MSLPRCQIKMATQTLRQYTLGAWVVDAVGDSYWLGEDVSRAKLERASRIGGVRLLGFRTSQNRYEVDGVAGYDAINKDTWRLHLRYKRF